MGTLFIIALIVSGSSMLVVAASRGLWWLRLENPDKWFSAATLLSVMTALSCGIALLITAASVTRVEWRSPAVVAHAVLAGFAAALALAYCVPVVRRSILVTRTEWEWKAKLAELEGLRARAVANQAAEVVDAAIEDAVRRIETKLTAREAAK